MNRYVIVVSIALALAACSVEPEAPSGPPGAASPGDTWTRPADGALMVFVPAGEFVMGSGDMDPEAADDEKPQHMVTLDAFWIDRTEVTNTQYAACVEAGSCEKTNCSEDGELSAPDQPAVCVSWHHARAYADWVGGRLPTEAEWEKAARGTDGRTYPWGNTAPDCQLANYETCSGRPDAVGSHPEGASPYGALNMAGNALEWVADWHDRDYYSESPPENPQGPDFGIHRVLRGGAYEGDVSSLRSAVRFRDDPPYGNRITGFRVVVAQASPDQ